MDCGAFAPGKQDIGGSISYGHCRRECPRGRVSIMPALFGISLWPKVRSTDWCDDFYTKEDEDESISKQPIGFSHQFRDKGQNE